MGDRAQVLMTGEKVYLYTHWGGSNLDEVVKTAIARKQRWDDEEYLARIIFSEMTKHDIEGDTGFGISTEKHGDIWRLIEVDCDKQTITISDDDKEPKVLTFEAIAKIEAETPV